MDPNENIARQRELAENIVALGGSLEIRETGKPTRAVWDYADELAELVLAQRPKVRHGTAPNGRDCFLNPDFTNNEPRFTIRVRGYEPEDTEDGGRWTHKLDVTDNRFLDGDKLPAYSIASGVSWEAAYECAFYFIRQALAHPDVCVFI
jgi:hypothetical protein